MSSSSDNQLTTPFSAILPSDINAEKALLGSILISGNLAQNLLDSIVDKLQSQHFFEPMHQIIYQIMVELYQRQQSIDTIQILDQIKKVKDDKKRDPKSLANRVTKEYLDELLIYASLLSNPGDTARLIRQKYILRGIISSGEELKLMAFREDKDPEAILDIAQQRLFQLTMGNSEKNFIKIGDIAHETLTKIDLIHTDPSEYNGIKTNFYDLDHKLGGLHNSDLIILACRPSMGKTAMSLALALKTAKQGRGVAYFSLEMSSDQLCERLIAAESQIDFRKIRSGELDTTTQAREYDKMGKAVATISELPIWVDDTATASVLEIRSKARRLKQRQDIGLIIIDYLQLMGGGNDKVYAGNRVQEVSDISRNLKVLAKDLNVPIIALSQLSRKVEQRDDKRPMLSDLRESGSIEQDADIVLFIHREDYYNKNLAQEKPDQAGKAEIIIAKNRNGETGFVEVAWIKHLATFDNLDGARLGKPKERY